MSEAGLQSALEALQLRGDVVAHGPVAILVTGHPEQLAEPALREAAFHAASVHGFRTLAVELPSDASGAHVPGP